MAFPEFEPGRPKLLFFSRGRGRGHAVPDIAIGRSLQATRPDVSVRFVSYGSGACAFEEAEIPAIDLGLPDAGGIVRTSMLAGKLIRWLGPDLVVAHEEFPALPAAKIFDKRTILITDWFLEKEGYATNCLEYADEILFLGPPDIFTAPPAVQGRIRYLGPMLRPFRYGPGDRARAKRDLGVPPGATLVSVLPGSWLEAQTPSCDAVLAAFDAIAGPKRLIWLAGSDYACIHTRTAATPGIAVLQTSVDVDRIMAATDLAITKSNRKTVYELQWFRVPTIAITFGLNAGDDLAVAAINNVTRVDSAKLSSGALANAVAHRLAEPRPDCELQFCGPEQCADLIARHLP